MYRTPPLLRCSGALIIMFTVGAVVVEIPTWKGGFTAITSYLSRPLNISAATVFTSETLFNWVFFSVRCSAAAETSELVTSLKPSFERKIPTTPHPQPRSSAFPCGTIFLRQDKSCSVPLSSFP